MNNPCGSELARDEGGTCNITVTSYTAIASKLAPTWVLFQPLDPCGSILSLGLAATPDQIIGGDPIHQAFLTLDVKRQHVIAVQ